MRDGCVQFVGITCNPYDARAAELGGQLAEWLMEHQIGVLVNEEAFPATTSVVRMPMEQLSLQVALMIVIGGDGTLLHAGRYFLGKTVPLLAINLGRLGFLTDTPAGSMLDVVAQALDGKLVRRSHFSVDATCFRGEEQVLQGVAINDVVIQRGGNPRMVTFSMTIRDQFVFRMRADGLVLATPAGSTAYALSAGGAIIHPEVEAISVVPICPHTLSNRPIVVPADDRIVVTVNDCPAALVIDGKQRHDLQDGDAIVLQRGMSFTLLHEPQRHYYEVLRNKLNWAGQAEQGLL
ncbi:MAG: NAD(+)/NADH kinase [Mariprofundales bacterium]|nr:NAD(+)/NADH kinase [Mariprofundales bacterium]